MKEMFAELGVGAAAIISSVGGIYAVVVSRSTREANTRKTAGEAADLITEAAGRFTQQIQEHAKETTERNRELVNALNTLIDVLDELLEDLSQDGGVLAEDGCTERVANKTAAARLRAAVRQAKLAT